MNIGITTGPRNSEFSSKYRQLLKHWIQRWANKHPEHQFYIFERQELLEDLDVNNLYIVSISVNKNLPFYEQRWATKFSSLVKKMEIAQVLLVDTFPLPLKNSSQWLIISQPATRYKNLDKASGIFVFSQKAKQALQKAGTVQENIHVVHGYLQPGRQVSDDEEQQIKEKYTEGKEFFLVEETSADATSLLQLLKGFSIFKKRQKTSMRLLVVGSINGPTKKMINTYKYKDEVVLLENLSEEETLSVSSSAYAVIDYNKSDNLFAVLQVMSIGVPILSSDTTPLKEIATDTALYFNEEDITDIADKLMLIYKDESLRGRMIEAGRNLTKQYSVEKMADDMWQVMQGLQNN